MATGAARLRVGVLPFCGARCMGWVKEKYPPTQSLRMRWNAATKCRSQEIEALPNWLQVYLFFIVLKQLGIGGRHFAKCL
jgi:hypothetical protein